MQRKRCLKIWLLSDFHKCCRRTSYKIELTVRHPACFIQD